MKIEEVHIEVVVTQYASQRQQIRAIRIVTVTENDDGRATQSEQQPALMLPPGAVSKAERKYNYLKDNFGD